MEGCLGGKQYCKGGSFQLRGIAESEGNTYETIVSLHHNWRQGILSYFYWTYYQKSRGCCWAEEGVANDFAKALLAIRGSQDVVDAGLHMRAITSIEYCEQVNDIGQTRRHCINSSLWALN